eukprot:COSAG03_NODE_23738_length_277_cov_0.876404_1_plen_58_part_01
MEGAVVDNTASIVKTLEARGYDRDLVMIALEMTGYNGVEQAAALLSEWSQGGPAPPAG